MQPMTPIRACQVATKLLRNLEAAGPARLNYVSDEDRAAIEVLRRVAASAIGQRIPRGARLSPVRGPKP